MVHLYDANMLDVLSDGSSLMSSSKPQISADMKIGFIGDYRYRPIWKKAYRSYTATNQALNIKKQAKIGQGGRSSDCSPTKEAGAASKFSLEFN